jgi:hypothetical protein
MEITLVIRAAIPAGVCKNRRGPAEWMLISRPRLLAILHLMEILFCDIAVWSR